MAIQIESAGVHATIQDLGRMGTQKYGVVVSGAMDRFALRIANLLVGNNQDEAGLEVMFYGTSMMFQKSHVIAITGADLQPRIEGELVSMWRPVYVEKGSIITFKGSARGCFAYLGIAGGFDVPLQMGSKSTFTRAKIGGFEGRALEKDDILAVGEQNHSVNHEDEIVTTEANWYVNTRSMYAQTHETVIRITQGSECDYFTDKGLEEFTSKMFRLTIQADRMGYTFFGPELIRSNLSELLSEGVTYGTIQVPENGQPIILMADRQTTGGYPKIAQVISADLPKLAQLQPNSRVIFELVSMEEAEQALFQMEAEINDVAIGIQLKMKTSGR